MGRRDALMAEGLDPEALMRESHDAEFGDLLLTRFAEIVRTIGAPSAAGKTEA